MRQGDCGMGMECAADGGSLGEVLVALMCGNETQVSCLESSLSHPVSH